MRPPPDWKDHMAHSDDALRIHFIGNATVLLRYRELTLLTDPNFLHRGQRAYLGYGLVSRRLTEPALHIRQLPDLSPVAPHTLLLGRYDDDGQLRYTGRTTNLTQAASGTLTGLLTPARRGHPWTGWSFSAGWGSRETLDVTLVEPELVVEVGVDVARDASGRWRHPARLHRPRTDLSPTDVPGLSPH